MSCNKRGRRKGGFGAGGEGKRWPEEKEIAT